MNYENIYNNLIISRKKLNRSKKDEIYYEWHHIIPKSLGGTNTKENLVLLTAREHFIAHMLLPEMYDGVEKCKMSSALWKMAHTTVTNKNRVISARQYEYIKKIYVNSIKGKTVEERYGNEIGALVRKFSCERRKGKKHSEQTKRKISLAQKGLKRTISAEATEKRKKIVEVRRKIKKEQKKLEKRNKIDKRKLPWTEEHKFNLAESKKRGGKNKCTEGRKKKISLANKGQVRTEQQKKNISEGKIGKPCPWMVEINKKRSSISISQFDLNGNWIKDFSSIIEASRNLGLKDGTFIGKCCKGKVKKAYSYIWKYKT